jgi:hypothetical protein
VAQLIVKALPTQETKVVTMMRGATIPVGEPTEKEESPNLLTIKGLRRLLRKLLKKWATKLQ